jgi:hypothetical protein
MEGEPPTCDAACHGNRHQRPHSPLHGKGVGTTDDVNGNDSDVSTRAICVRIPLSQRLPFVRVLPFFLLLFSSSSCVFLQCTTAFVHLLNRHGGQLLLFSSSLFFWRCCCCRCSFYFSLLHATSFSLFFFRARVTLWCCQFLVCAPHLSSLRYASSPLFFSCFLLVWFPRVAERTHTNTQQQQHQGRRNK